jgi:hypothetical protein
MDDYFSKPYYDANATRQSADSQLGASYRGAFVVRPSSQPGQLALSVYDGKVRSNKQTNKKKSFYFFIFFILKKKKVVAHTAIVKRGSLWTAQIG